MHDPARRILPDNPQVVHAGHPSWGPAETAALRRFVIQPESPWFSAPEQVHFSRALGGEFAAVSDDYAFFASSDGIPVAHAWYQVSRRDPRVAVLGYVFTDPAWRGKGLSQGICSRLWEHFAARGGEAMYLGTGNPAARRIYEKLGFAPHHGNVMRRLTPSAKDPALEPARGRPASRVAARPADWGDLARLVALCTGKFPWIVRDHAEGFVLPPGAEMRRCVSIGVALLLRAEAPGNSLGVLESEDGRIVGCASIVEAPAAQPRTLEFIVHPDHAASAVPGLRALLPPATPLLCHASPADSAKLGILRDLGFAAIPGRPDADGVVILGRT